MRMEQLEATVREAIGGRGLETAQQTETPEKAVKVHGNEQHAQVAERVEQTDKQPGNQAEDNKGFDAEMDEEKLASMIEELNQKFGEEGIELKYLLVEDSGDVQVEVREADSERVLRKIPPDDLVRLTASLKEMAQGDKVGKLLDTSF